MRDLLCVGARSGDVLVVPGPDLVSVGVLEVVAVWECYPGGVELVADVGRPAESALSALEEDLLVVGELVDGLRFELTEEVTGDLLDVARLLGSDLRG